MKTIPLIKPHITREVKDAVCEVLDSGFLTEGPVTRRLEDAFTTYIGCRHALAVCNCTVGLEMALRVLGIGCGDEVIIPDYTYPATADVVSIVGATIVIVDVDKETMLIDYDALEQAITPSTRAIIPVSIFGNPLDYERLSQIKSKFGLYIIEDAACAIGAEYKGIKVGNLADISVFSLHPRKFITTGEGGIVTTHNDDWAQWMFSYSHFGMGKSESRQLAQFERIGTNYKMSNILAAIGVVQMQHMDELLSRRLELAQNYIRMLSDVAEVSLPKTTQHGVHSRQSFCIYLDNRDRVLSEMKTMGIETQIGTYSLHMQRAFSAGPECRIIGDMATSRYIYEHCLTLPLYHDLKMEDQEHIVESLRVASSSWT